MVWLSFYTIVSGQAHLCVFFRCTRSYHVPSQTNDIWEEQKGEGVKNASPTPQELRGDMCLKAKHERVGPRWMTFYELSY